MMDTLFRRVRLIDPASGLDLIGELLVRGGRIADLGASLGAPEGAAQGVEVIEAEGAVLCPG
ncbi:MAG: dihydroorotase, partial [Acetobacteraceae bacterium]